MNHLPVVNLPRRLEIQENPWQRVEQAVMLAWGAIIVLTLLQLGLLRLLKWKGVQAPAFLKFPKPQLMLGMFLFPTITDAAAACFKVRPG